MTRRLPSLNQLRAFEAAARHKSFKAGAAELCVTQAAVSHQIKALEETLGLPLFVRKTREVDLTPDAERLADVLTRAFDQIETTTLEITGKTLVGEVKISAAPFYGNRWLLPRLARFQDAHPGLTVSVSLSFDLVDLKTAGFDAALRFGQGVWPGLTSFLIHNDVVGPVCSPQLLQGRKVPLPPDEIAALPLATTSTYAREWDEWFSTIGHLPETGLQLTEHPNRALAFDAALSGQGVCLADIRLTQAVEEAGNLIRLHPAVAHLSQGMYLVQPENRRSDPRVMALTDWLREEADQTLSTKTDPTE